MPQYSASSARAGWAARLHVLPQTDHISQSWYLVFWAVFVGAMTGASFKLNKVLTAILVFVTLLELLLGIGSFTGVTDITRAGAMCGMISAILGLYLAPAQLWNRAFGRTVLPVGEWKS